MPIPKEAAECWYHSCAAHYCLVESWTQPCTYPDCKVKDWATGKPYYMEHKKPPYRTREEITRGEWEAH